MSDTLFNIEQQIRAIKSVMEGLVQTTGYLAERVRKLEERENSELEGLRHSIEYGTNDLQRQIDRLSRSIDSSVDQVRNDLEYRIDDVARDVRNMESNSRW